MARSLTRGSLLPVLVIAAAAWTGAAPASAREPTPLEVFERFRKDRDPKVRAKAVEQLRGERGGDVVRALLRALRDEDEGVRGKAAGLLVTERDRGDEIEALAERGLGKQPDHVRLAAIRALARSGARAVPALHDALDDRDPAIRRHAALALSRSGDPGSPPLLSEALTDREALVRAAACEALGWLRKADDLGTPAGVMLGDRAPEPKVAAAEILGRFPAASSVPALKRGLSDRSWSVRVACAVALREFGRDTQSARAAAAALVPALARERRERVRGDMAEALRNLTGIDFGVDPERWTAWFAETRGEFEPPPRRARRRKKHAGRTQGHLLDLPIGSDHVCFVLDNSHSMNDEIRFGARTTKQETLLRAFESVVNRLPDGSYMNLIPFGTRPMPYKDRLFPAKRSARRGAVRYLAKRIPDGRTNLYDSLELALSDDATDTLVVVTDGAPSEGARKTRRSILAGVRELNRYRLVRIHTVEVGAANTGARWRGFLEELADAAGGHYLSR